MNTKLWNLYKQTDECKKLLEIFNPESEDLVKSAADIISFQNERDEEDSLESDMSCFLTIADNFNLQGYEFEEEATREGHQAFFESFEMRGVYAVSDEEIALSDDPKDTLIAKDDYRAKNSLTTFISLFFYQNHPFYKPLLYPWDFSYLMQNCEMLGIELPTLPKPHDYLGAFMWYYDACAKFNEFQDEYNLTDAEFCAALYGLAPTLKDDESKKELPKPINVWLTGASKEDVKQLEKAWPEESRWQCNQNTRRGDIVVVYAVSPHSCIHSIWRANSEGTFNPFDYRQCRTRVTNGVKITPIKLAQLKEHPVFGTLPMLNNNLQGVGGKMLPSWAYTALLEMIEANGDDMSQIPVLFENKEWNPGVMENEKAVEEKILIPALRDLGYVDGDWERQLKQKAGRQEKAIPDFVFFPYGEKHAENAPLIIEAKWHMSSEKERNDCYRQARSYAKMMSAGIMGICDDERLIIYKRDKNDNFDYTAPAFEAHWAAISGDAETHDRLMKLIGAEVIKQLVKKK